MEAKVEDCLSAVSLFDTDAAVKECKRIGCGHINATFLCVTDKGKFTLQKMDVAIFRSVDKLMDNISAVTAHVAKKGGKTIAPVKAKNGKKFVEYNGGTYRLMTYVDGEIKERITDPSDMETVGKGFGKFQEYLRDFDGVLYDTIPDFHNTPKRYADFIKTASVPSERRKRAENLIERYAGYKKLCDVVEKPLKTGEIPYRVTHNDTKINNLVIGNDGSLTVIDLDTVMKGSLLYDFGDAIRSGGTTRPEDSPEIGEVKADPEFYEAFCKGFLTNDLEVTDKERSLLPMSAFLYTYECGMRFLTDYLNNDVYFGAKYPEHNLVRAENQLVLAEDVLRKLDLFTRITDGFFR